MAEPVVFNVAMAPSGEVLVRGEIDLQTGPSFEAALSDAIRGGTGDLIVDLSGVEFMDSAGLNVFVRAYKHLIEQDRGLVVRGPSERVRRILDMGGADAFLTYT
jgi:anti-sigma B factor antagonist